MKSLISTGQASALLQQMPSRIVEAANDLGIAPELKLNGTSYFRESDLESIARHIAQSQSVPGGHLVARASGIS